MNGRRALPGIAAALCAAVLAGCGGGGGGPTPIGPAASTGGARFTIEWPEAIRLIPLASNSIKIEIARDGSPVANAVLERPAEGGQSSARFDSLPVGELVATATAYPEAGAAGTSQAGGSVAITIVAGQETTVALTMQSTIDRIEITPASPMVEIGVPLTLTATPRDAAGNVVLVANHTIEWSCSDTACATISADGVFTPLAAGTVEVTARYTEPASAGDPTPSGTKSIAIAREWRGVIALRCASTGDPAQSDIYLISPTASPLIIANVSGYGSVRWSPNGSCLAYRDPGGNLVIASRNGSTVYAMGAAEEQISWSADGRYVLSGIYYSGIYSYSTSSQRIRLMASKSATYDHNPVQSRDGTWVYFLHHEWGSECSIYAIETEKLVQGTTFGNCTGLGRVTTARNEDAQIEPLGSGQVILGYGSYIGVIDRESRSIEQKLSMVPYYMRISPDERYLGVVSSEGLKVVDLTTWQVAYTLQLPGYGNPDTFAWSDDSTSVAMATDDGAVFLWSFGDREPTRIFQKAAAVAGTPRSRTAYGETSVSISWTQSETGSGVVIVN